MFNELCVKLGWGLDGWARWRKVTITVAVTLTVVYFSNEFSDFVNKIWLRIGWSRTLRKVTITVALAFSCGFIFNGI